MNVVTRITGAVIGLVLAALTLGAPAEARTGHAGYHARGHHTQFTRHAHYRHRHHRIRSAHSRRHAHRSARRGHHASGGNASWYGPGFQGRRTANGERFNSGGFTAAHRSLPFGTRVRVTNNATGRSVVVRINDRGPFVRGRQIDLAAGAARAIGMSGTSYVSMAVVR